MWHSDSYRLVSAAWLSPYWWASQWAAGWATGWQQGLTRASSVTRRSPTQKAGSALLRLHAETLRLNPRAPFPQQQRVRNRQLLQER